MSGVVKTVKKTIDSFTGGKQAAKAARQAAEVQERAGERAITSQEETRDIARRDLDPFRRAGLSVLDQPGGFSTSGFVPGEGAQPQGARPGLQSLITDPNAQRQFIENNPFFDALAQRSTDTLLANQAAKGKVGSGGTAEALQNSLVLLGSDLLNQNIQQRQNLLTLGQNAAAGQATSALQTGANIGNLMTGIGNVQAAGIVGARNAINQGRGGLIDFATGLFGQKTNFSGRNTGGGGAGGGANAQTAASLATALCDERAKENIEQVGIATNGLPLYRFNYKGDNVKHINFMAQDVEKVYPDAVIEKNGFKYIIEGKLCA